jgi:two-component system cell cycle sensor histidine kinase/response regulator CckA
VHDGAVDFRQIEPDLDFLGRTRLAQGRPKVHYVVLLGSGQLGRDLGGVPVGTRTLRKAPTTSVGQVPMERLRSVFDGMFDGVWLVAADGRTTYCNAAMARLLGSTQAEVRGRPITDFLAEAIWSDMDGFLARQREQAGERMELCLRRVDGSDLFALVAGSPITTPDGVFVGTMLNVSDVTGKRTIDAQVIQNQRMEAIGQFAGGIAHDFNNLLTSIHGYAELARASLEAGDPIRDDLDQVLVGAERATAITRKLLAFTRRQILVPVDVDPAQVIADLLPMLKALLGDDVQMVIDVEGHHGWVRVDPTQLEQVIVNLAVNARDAMPAGGTVTVSVHNLPPTDPERPDPDLTPGTMVRISVADTGTGMDEGTRARVFDPFFTTKSSGSGTGLGLSTVLGIVGQSGGQVHVETTLGMGSTFHVDLPCATPGIPAPPLQPVETDTRRPGVVLLVEDDTAVRELARRALEAAGYLVLAASDADQALRASDRWAERIDVLVTDLVMPGVHGPELAADILAQRPDMGVVFVSGYDAAAVGHGSELVSVGQFLPKPFTVASLTRAVSRVARQETSERME